MLTIQTPRLLLRPLTDEDAAPLFLLHREDSFHAGIIDRVSHLTSKTDNTSTGGTRIYFIVYILQAADLIIYDVRRLDLILNDSLIEDIDIIVTANCPYTVTLVFNVLELH